MTHTFVISTMIEFAIVLCIKNIQDLNANKTHPMGRLFNGKGDLMESNSTEIIENGKSGTSTLKTLSTCQKFDYMSLVIFVLSYFIFNIAYFIHFMNIHE